MYSAMDELLLVAISLPFFLLFAGIAPRSLESVLAILLRVPSEAKDLLYRRLGRRSSRFDWSKISPQIFVGGKPRNLEDLRELRLQNVGAVLAVMQNRELLLNNGDYDSVGLAFLCIPVPDYCAPSLQETIEGVGFLSDQLARGMAVYIHCRGGHGRSVVLAISLLMKLNCWPALKALEFVESKRKIASLRSLWGLRPQWRAVKRYESYLEQGCSSAKHAYEK
jgi:protein-tyrosine phosphatase